MEGRAWSPERAESALESVGSEGAARVLAAMQSVADDPFQGSRERHVLAPDECAVDSQVAAVEAALEDAQVDKSEIDFALGFTLTQDLLNASDVCAVHDRVGLRPDCYTTVVDAVCNSFQMQLALAEALLATGKYRRGLLVQCSAVSRTTPWEKPYSVHFGDGSTAVVVGRVASPSGLIAQAHETDGSLYRAKVSTVPGANWWEEGRIVSALLDRDASRRMFLTICDVGERLVNACYEKANASSKDVDFFAAHQATAWWRSVVQEHLGLEHARTFDTYPQTGTLSAANLPCVFIEARARGLLRDGDLVAMYQGGTGATYSASLLRWGGKAVD
jgi:3-oxoacyl-[acyl-carrier-protein] synthase-3